ncbi:hypothetical protein HPB50_015953 [Hyalomma asiaticum]|uniref:Uncharacterized protein n=1 Tax=Hyalomma asiaticum TaxID=266040 RepID=A0ACB7TPV6_HYAAI|nr:hypothetical protein HPB50_015953 [Hyalomma asiaticum]
MCYRFDLHFWLSLLHITFYDEFSGATTTTVVPGLPEIHWEHWIQTFKNYMVASGASDLSAMRRKAILLSCLGLGGQRVFPTLTSMNIRSRKSLPLESH